MDYKRKSFSDSVSPSLKLVTVMPCSSYQFNLPVVASPALLATDIIKDKNGVERVYHHSDIYLLFNQKRISSTTITSLLDYLTSMSSPASDALSSLRSKVSDEQLLSLCKSRYIQTPSELLAWSTYLEQNYSQLLESIEVSSVDPASAGDPAPAGDPASASV